MATIVENTVAYNGSLLKEWNLNVLTEKKICEVESVN